jgi:hypothetical protein
MLRWLSRALAVLLIVGIVWLLRWDGGVQHGAELLPHKVTLRAGDRQELTLMNHEQSVAAVAFRLRFDDAVVAIDTAEPRYASVLDGGNAIEVPIRRAPGVLEVPGLAMTGGRAFKPTAPLYRFTLRGVAPGSATITVEGFTVVDASSFAQNEEPVAPARVTVEP